MKEIVECLTHNEFVRRLPEGAGDLWKHKCSPNRCRVFVLTSEHGMEAYRGEGEARRALGNEIVNDAKARRRERLKVIEGGGT